MNGMNVMKLQADLRNDYIYSVIKKKIVSLLFIIIIICSTLELFPFCPTVVESSGWQLHIFQIFE